MPRAAPHPCNRCRRALCPHGQRYCPPCHTKVQAQDVAYRGTAAQRGYDSTWTRLRARYAAEHHWCEDCLAKGLRIPVAIVDHITPHRGDDALRLSWDNLHATCRPCHQAKTVREGAGYRAKR